MCICVNCKKVRLECSCEAWNGGRVFKPTTTQCAVCGGGTGQVGPCVCPITMRLARGQEQGAKMTIVSACGTAAIEIRRNIEVDKLRTRTNFVSKFVTSRINDGNWPDNDVQRLVMMAELIDAWENRNKDS